MHDLRFGELKPCPFCGSEPYTSTCDVLIQIGCKKCDYHLHFKGLLRLREDHPDRLIGSRDDKYVYYEEAYEDAASKWNTRAI